MLDMMTLALAAAAAAPAVPEGRQEEPIDVRGTRMICRRINTSSAETRLNSRRVCHTQAEWDEIREEAVEFLNDLPRRNPRQQGRTIPEQPGASR